jgi:GNAT superfamily N-acetyltransferase
VRFESDRARLFGAGAFRAFELHAGDVPALQRFIDGNPEYYLAVNGQAPGAREAQEEFDGGLPAGWPYTKQWTIGFVDEAGATVAVASVVSDLLAAGVWHIGLCIVATSLHGSGAAQAMYRELEAWARGQGAQWLRLGVVEGNARAERFWERTGYAEVRKRSGVETGRLTHTVRVMVKPLAGGKLPEYLALVARDRPESP